MKCPKCGFNSFEYYDSCKKCSTDLTGYKQTYSISSVVLPSEAKEKLITLYKKDENPVSKSSDRDEMNDDIFPFDLPDEPSLSSTKIFDDPFNFDEPELEVKQSVPSKAEDDDFADLLESTSQVDDSPFSTLKPSQPASSSDTKTVDSSSPGEFDLESFSWDEPSTETSNEPAPAALDDFDSLFGETKENSSK